MSNFHGRKRLLRSKHNTKTDAIGITHHTKNMQHSNITRKRKKQYPHTPKKKKKKRIETRERNQTMNRKMVSEDPPHAQALPPPTPAPKPPSHLLHRRASRPGTGGDGGDAGEPRRIRGEAEPGGGEIGNSE